MPQTWLFQCHPDRFRIDEFLTTRPTEMNWLIRQHEKQIIPGDQVFIWRAIGNGPIANSGVVAEAEVITRSTPMPEKSIARPFWTNLAEADVVVPRVTLKIIRIANERSKLRRNWFLEDPILSQFSFFRFHNATDFSVTYEHAARLNALWDKTGNDWTYEEVVAGLWAYNQTFGHEVSRLPDSPVSRVALLIGRAVSGVYNKVMNFRYLDPRDDRTGMSGASITDQRVWTEFYDPVSISLQSEALEAEFQRLWADAPIDQITDEAQARDKNFERETRRLTQRSLDELIELYASQDHKKLKPKARSSRIRTYDRDPLVAAIAKKRVSFRCEAPGCLHSTFLTNDGTNYCEVHHIRPLSDGGEDVPGNVACLCPSHHREIHYGQNAEMLTQLLTDMRIADATVDTAAAHHGRRGVA